MRIACTCPQISGLTRTASNFFIYLLITWSSSNCLGEPQTRICAWQIASLAWLKRALCSSSL